MDVVDGSPSLFQRDEKSIARADQVSNLSQFLHVPPPRDRMVVDGMGLNLDRQFEQRVSSQNVGVHRARVAGPSAAGSTTHDRPRPRTSSQMRDCHNDSGRVVALMQIART